MTSLGNIGGELPIPPGIDARTEGEKDLFRATMEFERFFVQHMMKQMQSATQALAESGSEDNAVGGSAPQAYQDMVQDQMTQAVLEGGGLGLAASLYEQIRGPRPEGDEKSEGVTA